MSARVSEIPDELLVEPAAPRDAPDRTPDGAPLAPAIDGVRIHRPPRHVDHRGSLFEAVNFQHPFWDEPVVHCEWVITNPGRIKGWAMHKESVDRYVVGQGRLRVVLYDGRLESATHGNFASFTSAMPRRDGCGSQTASGTPTRTMARAMR